MINIFDRPSFQIQLNDKSYTLFPNIDKTVFRANDEAGNNVTDPAILADLYLNVSAIALAERLLTKEILASQLDSVDDLRFQVIDLYRAELSLEIFAAGLVLGSATFLSGGLNAPLAFAAATDLLFSAGTLQPDIMNA